MKLRIKANISNSVRYTHLVETIINAVTSNDKATLITIASEFSFLYPRAYEEMTTEELADELLWFVEKTHREPTRKMERLYDKVKEVMPVTPDDRKFLKDMGIRAKVAPGWRDTDSFLRALPLDIREKVNQLLRTGWTFYVDFNRNGMGYFHPTDIPAGIKYKCVNSLRYLSLYPSGEGINRILEERGIPSLPDQLTLDEFILQASDIKRQLVFAERIFEKLRKVYQKIDENV